MTSDVFVPRLVDATNRNAQNSNARMLLRYWPATVGTARTLSYQEPDPAVAARKGVEVVRLWQGHGWQPHLFLQYLRRHQSIFYPGVTSADAMGLRVRGILRMHGPVVATLEGLLGGTEREAFYSALAGHPVHCQPVALRQLSRADYILQSADHVIAISPFLAKMGRARYGDKFSVLPLGIDTNLFRPPERPRTADPSALHVIGAGRVAPHKRPELFLRLAQTFPDARFTWFGDGESRTELTDRAQSLGLHNVAFPGALSAELLAEEYRKADLFVLPSLCEGVPKVTQEAAACGLPIVLFGHYESPTVVQERTGYVVWTDEELIKRVAILLARPVLRSAMGSEGAQRMSTLSWAVVAPQWWQRLQDIGAAVRSTRSD